MDELAIFYNICVIQTFESNCDDDDDDVRQWHINSTDFIVFDCHSKVKTFEAEKPSFSSSSFVLIKSNKFCLIHLFWTLIFFSKDDPISQQHT